jgi:hypothetical protein
MAKADAKTIRSVLDDLMKTKWVMLVHIRVISAMRLSMRRRSNF